MDRVTTMTGWKKKFQKTEKVAIVANKKAMIKANPKPVIPLNIVIDTIRKKFSLKKRLNTCLIKSIRGGKIAGKPICNAMNCQTNARKRIASIVGTKSFLFIIFFFMFVKILSSIVYKINLNIEHHQYV
jgi:hypothetical protein